MAIANKTQPTGASVDAFLETLTNEQQRQDSLELINMMSEISGEPPKMWGPSIIGFGLCHYKYESGREGDMGVIGFSPRKGTLCVYFDEGMSHHHDQLSKLGPHKTGKVCLYIKRLSDINRTILRQMVENSYSYVMSHQHAMHRAD